MDYYRNDMWSDNDDLTLAETVLKHMRNGRTLREAYDVAATEIGRTHNACSQRWKAYLSKKYPAAIEIAKVQWQKKRYSR